MSLSRSCRRVPPPSAQQRQELAFQTVRRSGKEKGWLRMSSAYWWPAAGDGEESKKDGDHATGTAIASESGSQAKEPQASAGAYTRVPGWDAHVTVCAYSDACGGRARTGV